MEEIINQYIKEPKDEFLIKNQGLVGMVCKKFKNIIENPTNGGMEYGDLVGIGNIGLIKSYNRYNPEKFDTKFSTYAIPMIYGEIKRFLRDDVDSIRISRSIKDLYFAIIRADLIDGVDEVIAEKMGCTVEEVKAVKKAHIAKHIRSLDKEFSNGDSGGAPMALEAFIPDPIKPEDEIFYNIYIEEIMELLETKEQKAVFTYFTNGSDLTQAEVGRIMDVSQAQISRHLKKIRKIVLK